MYKVIVRKNKRAHVKARIRSLISGSAEVPRLTVFRSNKYVYAQLIDDTVGKTLVSVGEEVKKLHTKTPKVKAAFEVGKAIAQKAKELKITKAVFDRNGYIYHGRVKAVAEGAREGGLTI